MRYTILFTLLMGAQYASSQRCQGYTLLRVLRSNLAEALPFCHDYLHTVWKTVIVTKTIGSTKTLTEKTTISKTTTRTKTNTNTKTSTTTVRSPTITRIVVSRTTTTSYLEKHDADVTGDAFYHILDGFPPESLSSGCSCLPDPNTSTKKTTRTVTETTTTSPKRTTTKTSKTTATRSTETTVQTTITRFETRTIPTTTTTSTTAVSTTLVPRSFRLLAYDAVHFNLYYAKLGSDNSDTILDGTKNMLEAALFTFQEESDSTYRLIHTTSDGTVMYAYSQDVANSSTGLETLKLGTQEKIDGKEFYYSWNWDPSTGSLTWNPPTGKFVMCPAFQIFHPTRILVTLDPKARDTFCSLVELSVEAVF
ncbi:hypothetical protein QBC37DRAFT_380321 [Rhypophila decipiens]|uniref:Uncharacterized protein n=1 Tax=Rhypophila decipiens TaxID=261697 RepID=A0AAN6Y0S4_9PEZI|nr:hypothetical protein QBC37DRAFT_380321 [Rhypophila decipiens]